MDILTTGLNMNDKNITNIFDAIQNNKNNYKDYEILECVTSLNKLVLMQITVKYKNINFHMNLVDYKSKLVWQLFPYMDSYLVFPSLEIRTFEYLFYCMFEHSHFLINNKIYIEKNAFIARIIHILKYCIYKKRKDKY